MPVLEVISKCLWHWSSTGHWLRTIALQPDCRLCGPEWYFDLFLQGWELLELHRGERLIRPSWYSGQLVPWPCALFPFQGLAGNSKAYLKNIVERVLWNVHAAGILYLEMLLFVLSLDCQRWHMYRCLWIKRFFDTMCDECQDTFCVYPATVTDCRV